MLTVKSNLTALDSFSESKPESVSISINEEDMSRIKDAIAYLKKSGATYVKIRMLADLYHCSKDLQDEEYLNNSNEEYTWKESAEGLKIFLGSIYYETINDFDDSDVLESEDLTELCPELSALFKDEHEQKVIGYYVYGTEECNELEETGKVGAHSFEQREFNTLEEKNQFEAGIEAALGWEKVYRTSPEECTISNGVLTRK